eukprot:g2304.t1
MDFVVCGMKGNAKRKLSNFVFVHPDNFNQLLAMSRSPPDQPESTGILCKCRDFVFTVKPGDMEDPGCAAFNTFHRISAALQLGRSDDGTILDYAPPVTLTPFDPPEQKFALKSLKLEVGYRNTSLNENKRDLDCENLAARIKYSFQMQAFSLNQVFAVKHKFENGEKAILELKVINLEHMSVGELLKGTPSQENVSFDNSGGLELRMSGQLLQGVEGASHGTIITFKKGSKGKGLRLRKGDTGDAGGGTPFEGGLDLKKMGIGGLDKEFDELRTRAFNTRLLPPSWMRKFRHNHVRGILLYGPPGCGKTLIARKLAEALKSRPPKIVQGPELLDKYVGEAERKVRELFKEAEEEQEESGENSGLHVIIMDELDALCKARGTSGDSTGSSDNIVNQLLSKIDGVNSLNNVLLIGMTNRKDMLDEALLRPGR